MCAPILTLVTVASTAARMYGNYQEGLSTQRYYNAVADAREKEAQALIPRAQRQAELIQDTAKMKGKSLAEEQASLRGSQGAALAAMGIDPTSVTAGDISFNTLSKQKLDEALLRYQHDVPAWETMEEAKQKDWALKTEANQLRFAGKQARQKSYIDMTNSLLGGATSLAMGGFFDKAFTPFKVGGKTITGPGKVWNPTPQQSYAFNVFR